MARIRPEHNPAWPLSAGTYVLLLHVSVPLAFTAGHLGTVSLPAGHYAYVGSAHGPGGLVARLRRHLTHPKPLHWHIDYLTQTVPCIEVWAVAGGERRECVWVRGLLALPGVSAPVPGFGSSDCREGCPAHLLRLPDGVSIRQVAEMLV